MRTIAKVPFYSSLQLFELIGLDRSWTRLLSPINTFLLDLIGLGLTIMIVLSYLICFNKVTLWDGSIKCLDSPSLSSCKLEHYLHWRQWPALRGRPKPMPHGPAQPHVYLGFIIIINALSHSSTFASYARWGTNKVNCPHTRPQRSHKHKHDAWLKIVFTRYWIFFWCYILRNFTKPCHLLQTWATLSCKVRWKTLLPLDQLFSWYLDTLI